MCAAFVHNKRETSNSKEAMRMRRSDRATADPELSTRYALDESRFKGGRDHICNEEENHEPPTDLA